MQSVQNINVKANLFLMGNYFNELRVKIIRASTLLQLIHQVTIIFRFWNCLVQERFKSNLEFRYQIRVSSMKSRTDFAKFMILITLFKMFPNYQFIAGVEVSNMARCSSKTNELKNIHFIGCDVHHHLKMGK